MEDGTVGCHRTTGVPAAPRCCQIADRSTDVPCSPYTSRGNRADILSYGHQILHVYKKAEEKYTPNKLMVAL